MASQTVPVGLGVRPASFSLSNLGQIEQSSSSKGTTGSSSVRTSFSSSGKAGGSFRNISSNFDLNEANGTLSFSIPIPTTKSRSDFGPSLALSYDSGQGNAFGFGWDIAIASISRTTAKQIPVYDDEQDIFVLSGEDDLVQCLTGSKLHETETDGWTVRRYLPRTIKTQQRIERWTSQSDPADVHWRVISSDNVTQIFGQTTSSRISSKESGREKIFSWLLCFCYDPYGNCMQFDYKAENAEGITGAEMPSWEEKRSDEIRSRKKYIKSMKYGNRKPNRSTETWESLSTLQDFLFEVIFDYGEHAEISPQTSQVNPWRVRKDCFSNCTAGFEIRTYRLCRRILMFHHFLDENEKKENPWAHLEKRDRKDHLVSSVVLKYDELDRGSFLTSVQHFGHTAIGEPSGNKYHTESLPALEFAYTTVPDPAELSLKTFEIKHLPSLPFALSQLSQWMDLNGDGMPGILSKLGDGTLTYQRNKSQLQDSDSGFFSEAETLPTQPSIRWENDNYFEDLNGNGRKDLICLDENKCLQGYFEREEDEKWTTFSTFKSIPSEAQVSDVVERIDLTGDSLSDLLYINEDDVTWCRSLGSQGYGPRQTTRVGDAEFTFTGDSRTAVQFVDMTGDGLEDVVSISNGSIIYNSNLGHGSFGSEVRMGNPPFMDNELNFSHSRVRLLDVDGSGTADLLYLLPGGGANLYYNLSGNSWSDPVLLQNVPPISPVSSVFTLDLFGNGTSCLCWIGPSSTQHGMALHYLDLMDSQKPNLLNSYQNNMGMEYKVEYLPSTFYSLKDEADSKPWKSKVPFPIQCVAKVTTVDEISGSEKLTTYKYHDGYYDGVEREFNGFGMVETSIEETFKSPGGGFSVLPTTSRTFFCTGADESYLSEKYSSSRKLFNSYSTEIPPVEQVTALRAFKGLVIRKEIYGKDTVKPLSTEESSFAVHRVQSLSDSSLYPVYQTTPRETLSTTCGDTTDHDKTVHSMVLQTNQFGDVGKSARICYPCKVDFEHQSDLINTEQGVIDIELTEIDYTNAIDENHDFRTPLPWRTRKYNVDTTVIDDSELLAVQSINAMLYDDAATTNLTKSLTGERRVYYRSSDLAERLERALLQAYSVVDVVYELAFQPEKVSSVVEKLTPTYPKFTMSDLQKEGGYHDLTKDGSLWAQSSKYSFSKEEDDTIELESARRNFYTPVRVTDPFQNVQMTTMDEYALFSIESTNALEQSVSAVIDYERMQPARTTGVNENVQEVRFDAFGNIIGHAVLGRGGESTDNLDSFDTTPDRELLGVFFRNPTEEFAAQLLGSASSRILYALDRYHEWGSGYCPATAEISRPVPGKDTELRISIAYFDGRGRSVQRVEYYGEKEGTWWFSGYDVTDYAGKALRSYMPFYSDTASFVPVSSLESVFAHSFFDAMGRSLGHLAPNRTWSKTIYHPWYTTEYGPGGNIEVADPATDTDVGTHFALLERDSYYPAWLERQMKEDKLASRAADLSKVYSNTRHHTSIDAAGRTIYETEEAGAVQKTTRHVYDDVGNPIETYNTLDRLIQRRTFNFLGACLEESTIDAGHTWSVPNCLGTVIYSGNSRAIVIRKTYDKLQRPTETFLSHQAAAEELHQILVYGEDATAPFPNAANLLGKIWQVKDQSGIVTHERYDDRGRCTATTTRFAVQYKARLDWKKDPEMATKRYAAEFRYDQFGQLVEQVDAHGNRTRKAFTRLGNVKRVDVKLREGEEKVARLVKGDGDGDGGEGEKSGASNSGTRVTALEVDVPVVSLSAGADNAVPDTGDALASDSIVTSAQGLSAKISVDSDDSTWAPYIKSATFTAYNEPLKTDYGNRTTKIREYDPLTRNLVRETISRRDGTVLEDISNTYDCLDCKVVTSNDAQQDIYFRNCRIQPLSEYTYDAFGMLKTATSREQISDTPPTNSQPRTNIGSGDGSQLCTYMETFDYDSLGNLLSIHHEPASNAKVAAWTRKYRYDEPSLLDPSVTGNRLSYTSIGGADERVEYDDDAGVMGCITKMPGFSVMRYDCNNMLQATSKQFVNEGTPEMTYYVYNHDGNRVRKITERAAADGDPVILKETFYIQDAEIFIKYLGDATPKSTLLTSTITVESSIAILESTSSFTDDLLVRYQASTNLELDSQGLLVSYEEFSPFGNCTFSLLEQHVEAPRTYRFAAYRRDPETGLFHCGLRSYAPWLGRWTTPDPAGTADGPNVFAYCGNDPVNMRDPTGTTGDKKQGLFSCLFGSKKKFEIPVLLGLRHQAGALPERPVLKDGEQHQSWFARRQSAWRVENDKKIEGLVQKREMHLDKANEILQKMHEHLGPLRDGHQGGQEHGDSLFRYINAGLGGSQGKVFTSDANKGKAEAVLERLENKRVVKDINEMEQTDRLFRGQGNDPIHLVHELRAGLLIQHGEEWNNHWKAVDAAKKKAGKGGKPEEIQAPDMDKYHFEEGLWARLNKWDKFKEEYSYQVKKANKATHKIMLARCKWCG